MLIIVNTNNYTKDNMMAFAIMNMDLEDIIL